MDAGNAADDDAVFDGDMAGQAGAVAHDNVVTDDAVMSYMRAGLEEAVVADARFFPFASRRADRDEFPEPMEQLGKNRQSLPIVVQPSIVTWAMISVPSPMVTWGPITAYGPILTPAPIFACGSIIAVGCIML